MLRLVTGPFHPTLETHLVQDLRALKSKDPLASLAIVVPSDQLRRSLKRLLVLQEKLSLLNVHILSFHQLALQLDRERRTVLCACFDRLRRMAVRRAEPLPEDADRAPELTAPDDPERDAVRALGLI